jgi:hypothetical protein
MNHYVAPLFCGYWLMELLPSFARSRIFNNSRFLSPIYFWRFYCNSQRSNKILNLICSIPALYHCRLSKCFRRIGIKSTVWKCDLTVLTFGLLLPVFGLSPKNVWSVLFFVLAICFFAKHIQNPVMSMEKPNQQFIVSLQRWHRQSQLGNLWQNLDSWTKGYLGENKRCCGFKWISTV